MRLTWCLVLQGLGVNMRRARLSETEELERTWVPITTVNGVHYFNPHTGKMVMEQPVGAVLAPAVSFMQNVDGGSNDGSYDATAAVVEDDEAAAQEAEKAAERASAKVVGGFAKDQTTGTEQIVEGAKTACYPHCSWNCSSQFCNQDCAPDCAQPTCQTRCPKPDYSQCKINCAEPKCSVFCPKEPCHQDANEQCSSPKCSTQCARPSCTLDCTNHVPCQNVCHAPKCTWNCRSPQACPKPECHLICQKAAGCAQNYDLPPLSPTNTVANDFRASRASWVTGSWSSCKTKCGKDVQTRRVTCSTGQDHECAFSPKPATQQPCEDRTGCNAYQTGEWSKCSVTCGKGTRTRKVYCGNKDPRECIGEKPAHKEKCYDQGPHCTECNVLLHGGKYFTGWNAKFGVGKYNTEQLIAHGAVCEETSSVKVVGRCCHARLFQYGDFNKEHRGWKATLTKGEYDIDELQRKGVQDNDLSAMKVWVDKTCSTQGHLWKRKSHRSVYSRLGYAARHSVARGSAFARHHTARAHHLASKSLGVVDSGDADGTSPPAGADAAAGDPVSAPADGANSTVVDKSAVVGDRDSAMSVKRAGAHHRHHVKKGDKGKQAAAVKEEKISWWFVAMVIVMLGIIVGGFAFAVTRNQPAQA
uniref:Uncharacterized protein n=1 Tax=Oxyrrhis marina TaxID=2969 RepID=A0A7S4LPM8_OXYMA